MDQIRVTPVFKTLSAVRQIAGVEDRLFFLNIGFTLFMLISLHIWYWLFMTVVLHVILRNINRGDPNIRMVYLAYSRQNDRYVPWPLPNRQFRNLRPTGFGRGGWF